MDKKSIKEEIKAREEIVKHKEEEIAHLYERLNNNKKWIEELKDQLKIVG